MDIFLSTDLSVPMMQVVLLLSISTLSLIFGRLRLALLINYCFTLYWGYVANLDLFFNSNVKLDYFSYLYLGFGLVIIVLAMIGFVCHAD
jgi:uncharacterized membrane protein